MTERRQLSVSGKGTLIYLAPDILRRVLTGQLPPSVTLQNLLDAAQHLDWGRQKRYLRLDATPVKAA